MTVELVPDRLAVPYRVAMSLEFRGPDLTARDISYAFLVAWLAGQQGIKDSRIKLADNGLRMALARSRRDGMAKEEDRFLRLHDTVMVADGRTIKAPTLGWLDERSRSIHRGGLVREGDMQLDWEVDLLTDAMFRAPPDEARMVEVDTHLIRHARAKWSLHVMLRLAGWVAGGARPEWVRVDEPGFKVIRIPVQDALERLDLGKPMSPGHVVSKVLAPALEEINALTDWHCSVEVINTTYRAGPGRPAREGKPLAMEFRLAFPIPELQEPVRYPPKRKPGQPWKRAVQTPGSRPRKVEPVIPVDTTVVPLKRGFGNMRTVERTEPLVPGQRPRFSTQK